MTPNVRPLVAGNWKMNGTRASLDQIKAMAEGVKIPLSEKVDTLICPPATLLYVATALCDDSPLLIGAQDCHQNESGAHTGEISAEMIADCEQVVITAAVGEDVPSSLGGQTFWVKDGEVSAA